MRIAMGSMFRDSHAYLDRALHQYELFAKEVDRRGDHPRFIFCENDSVDDTYERLSAWAGRYDTTLVQRSDGCPYWPSVDRRERWRHLAWVANGVLEQVDDADDVVIYVESDLAWEAETMLRLVDHLNHVDAVSPLNMRHWGTYYDVWGSRGMDGRRFSAHHPYHPDLEHVDVHGLAEVQSIAGCTAMVADVARSCRFSPDDCYIGFNRAVRVAGWRVWCDPDLRVEHA